MCADCLDECRVAFTVILILGLAFALGLSIGSVI